jgi:hypothetical protein
MPVPIPDLRLDDDGISCTLSFNRAPFFCVVPWSSIFAMVGDDGRGMVWPDDVPAEVARQAQGRADGAARKEPSKPAPAGEAKVEAVPKPKRSRSKRPALAAVPDGSEAAVSKPHAKADHEAPPPPRPIVAQAPGPRPSTGATGSARKKRELPPYLRVVK